MKLKLTLASLAMIAQVLLFGATGHAQDASLTAARAAFDRAQVHYMAGDYAKAAVEFEAAYASRPFPQFLFNIGASHEKLRDYAKAVSYYERYIKETKDDDEKKQTAKRIEVLKKEIERIKATPPDAANPDEQSAEVKALAEAKIRGGIVIESQPQGAEIFLDDKNGKSIGRTPLNLQLSGQHRIFFVKEGYKPVDREVNTGSDKLVILVVAMAEEDYLGFVEITSNVPQSDIYVDDKAQGVYKQTPWKGNLPPGKHKIWITKEGYDEFSQEINVVAGQTQRVKATLSGGPVGYVNVRGPETDRNKIYVDGKILCQRGPCRRPLREGDHTIRVRRSDYKTYQRNISIQAKTELTVYAKLAKKPGRGDAIFAYVMTAAFAGGGIYALSRGKNLRDDLKAEIADNGGGVTQSDGRFTQGKIWTGVGFAGVGLAAVSGAFALYYTFRDKGPPSTGTVDVKAVTLTPTIGNGYAGLGLGGSF